MVSIILKTTIIIGMLLGVNTTTASADGLPRFYELINSVSDLESGKHYLLVASYQSTSEYMPHVAYNGFDETNSKGLAGAVSPTEHAYPIIDLNGSGNNAQPIRLEAAPNGKWYIVDASSGTYLGTNSQTTGSEQHNLLGSSSPETVFFQWQISYEKDPSEDDYWFVENGGKINYYLKYDNNNGDGLFRLYTGKWTDDKSNIYQLYKEMSPVDVAVGFTGYGTLYYSDKALLVSDVAATVSAQSPMAHTCALDETRNLTYTKNYPDGSIIPKNNAVVITGTANTHYTFYETRNTGDAPSGNSLRGRDEAGLTTTEGNDNNYYFYKLTTREAVEGTDNGSTAFYWGAAGGGPFTIPAHKAFLAVEKGDAANIQFFTLDFATDVIGDVSCGDDERHPSSIIDMSGRKIADGSCLQRGIYIIDGKKMVVR